MAPRASARDQRVPHPSLSKGAGVRPIRNPLKRYYARGELHFVTFSCHRRKSYLGTRRARDRVVKILDQVRTRWECPLIGYVVMPEDIHLLIGEPGKGDPSKVLQVLKQKTSRILRAKRRGPVGQLWLRFPDAQDDWGHFWQRRFYDFNVWSAKKLREKLEYMHANPVKRKLAAHPKDWPWSSWSYYAKRQRGLITIDSANLQRKTSSEANVKPRTLEKNKGAAPAAS
jgi:putative transposase